MMKMSVENLYATKYGFGSGCIVKGDGYRLELGGTSKGDTGGTKIGVADEYGIYQIQFGFQHLISFGIKQIGILEDIIFTMLMYTALIH